jgi:hypothetical protein
LQPKDGFSEDSTSVNRARGVFSSKCRTLPSANLNKWRVLVPEAAVVQGLPVLPIIHNKPIQKSLDSDLGKEHVNKHTAQDDGQSSTSRHPDAPDTTPTTAAIDVPSTYVLPPLPFSSARGTSYVDIKNESRSSGEFKLPVSNTAAFLTPSYAVNSKFSFETEDITKTRKFLGTDLIIAYGLSQVHQSYC